MINCPNPECQTANPEGSQTCRSCNTPILHRYLWVVGNGHLDHLDKRYSWQHHKVVLDTQPGLIPPPSPEPVPPFVMPYLALAPHSLHVPQPYAFFQDSREKDVLLLDRAPFAFMPKTAKPELLPSVREVWKSASPLRQLNWLWQIVGLWPDFVAHGVARSLLFSPHLKADGGIIRLLELPLDDQRPSLQDLATAWQPLVPDSHGSIQPFLQGLCAQLLAGDIATPEILRACFNQAIADAAQGYQSDHQLAVITHQGPSRKRNEDSCYPASGSNQTHGLGPKAGGQKRPLLLLVCDGIGGHEGGDVASRLAIFTIQQHLSSLLDELTEQPVHNPAAVTAAIQQAIAAANDQISQHNDQGLRQARDRMGTTVVMALIVGVHCYIAHVGDSRAYHISADSCQQITFDDDVAAREVRLGYGFHADISTRPGTGALIQALGMGGSAALHIGVQRLILEGDALLLLCSDGLSDYDRVEQFWQPHLRPVLLGNASPAKAVNGLLQVANTQNGHDNVTIGVVAAHSAVVKPAPVPGASPELAAATLPPAVAAAPPEIAPPPITTIPQDVVAPIPQTKSLSWSWLGAFSLLGLVAAATALTMVFFREGTPVSSTEATSPLPETIQDKINQNNQKVGISDNETVIPSLQPGNYLRLSQPVVVSTTDQPTDSESDALGQLSEGAVVQVLTRQEIAGEEALWIKVKACDLGGGERADNAAQTDLELATSSPTSVPATQGAASAPANVTQPGVTSLTSGAEGWILEAQLAPNAVNAAARGCSPG